MQRELEAFPAYAKEQPLDEPVVSALLGMPRGFGQRAALGCAIKPPPPLLAMPLLDTPLLDNAKN